MQTGFHQRVLQVSVCTSFEEFMHFVLLLIRQLKVFLDHILSQYVTSVPSGKLCMFNLIKYFYLVIYLHI